MGKWKDTFTSSSETCIVLQRRPPGHQEFLLSRHQGGSHYHKNVSYRPHKDRVRGFPAGAPGDLGQLQAIMREYYSHVTQFLARFLLPYAAHWSLDCASFRPFE